MLLRSIKNSDLPTFLAGDFNSVWTGPERARDTDGHATAIRLLLGSGAVHTDIQSAPTTTDQTFPAHAPRDVIDWILAPDTWSFQSRRAIQCDMSDHLPVIAIVRPAE